MDFGCCEFLCEDEPISVIPSFTDSVMHLITGDVGPFEAGEQIQVPLWLALFLKTSNKCRIVPPSWLTVVNVKAMIEREVASDLFTDVPEHIFAVTRMLGAHASVDVAGMAELTVLVRNLQDRREGKLRTSIMSFISTQGVAHAAVNHLTQFEIATIRPFFATVMDTLNSMTKSALPHLNA